MRAIIPVAGIGTRLKPHTYSTPKVLLMLAVNQFLGIFLINFWKKELNKATFVIGHLGDMIKEFVERNILH